MHKTLAFIAILLLSLPALAQDKAGGDEPPLPRQRPAELGVEKSAGPAIRPAWTVAQPAEKPLVPLPRVRPTEKAKTPAADHFHVDLGCHGKTCTARLCE